MFEVVEVFAFFAVFKCHDNGGFAFFCDFFGVHFGHSVVGQNQNLSVKVKVFFRVVKRAVFDDDVVFFVKIYGYNHFSYPSSEK